MFLFEEFVPLEYRQQLSAGVQNKRTLASFFSPGKTKQWKQAATLNGRPYVVGHVPRSLNSREAEFEGLLRGNNSSTKVISLGRDGPVRREIPHPGSGPTSSSQSPHTRPEISSPLFVAPREETTPRPSTPLIQPSTQAGIQGTGNGTKRRFRLPTGLPRSPHPRTSGLTPSQAEDVEFETRLASYSDDELNSMNTNSRKMTKEERRRSKDDAWVDILVASHSRRAGNQDAELRRPGGPRPRNASRQDPEVASQEVAQVLAGIRGPSPPFDGESVDIEPMNVPHRSRMDSTGTVLDEIYAPTIPGSVDLAEPEGVQVAEPQRPQRRMGYFDLHPERRHVHVGGDGGDMDQFAQAAGGHDIEALPRRSDTTESVYSSGPTPPASPKQALTRLNTERLHPDPAVSSLSPPSPVSVPTPSPQTPTYTQRDLQRQQEVRDRLSGKPGPKASSLIEMYREKERQAASSKGSPGKSAGASSQEQPAQLPAPVEKQSAPVAPLSALQPDLSPSALDFPGMGHEDELEGDGEDYIEPPNIEFDHGRDSPFRYVHGAPLHNVVEEEEEE